MTQDIPLACTLTAAEMQARRQENAELLSRAIHAEDLPDGAVYTFPPTPELARAVLDFVLAERACCAFLTFTLRFASPHANIYLEIQGPVEMKPHIRFLSAATGRIAASVSDTPAAD
jgi:hypothetical protein